MRTGKLLVLLMLTLTGCIIDKKDDITPSTTGYDRFKNTGLAANDILSAAIYNKITIQFSYMPGFEPDAGAVALLKSFLETYCNKPGGINIVQQQIPAGGKPVMNISDVSNTENLHRTAFTSGSNLALHVLITDGAYKDANVLGVAYFNTSLCLFGNTIHSNSGGIGQASRTKLMATVLEHELGHLMGLVDIGSPQQVNHMDIAHGNHCDNNTCLMYYTAETTDMLGFLISGNIPAPDTNCKNDMKANGGK